MKIRTILSFLLSLNFIFFSGLAFANYPATMTTPATVSSSSVYYDNYGGGPYQSADSYCEQRIAATVNDGGGAVLSCSFETPANPVNFSGTLYTIKAITHTRSWGNGTYYLRAVASCPAGYSLSGDSCALTDAAKAAKVATCASGGTLLPDGLNCSSPVDPIANQACFNQALSEATNNSTKSILVDAGAAVNGKMPNFPDGVSSCRNGCKTQVFSNSTTYGTAKSVLVNGVLHYYMSGSNTLPMKTGLDAKGNAVQDPSLSSTPLDYTCTAISSTELTVPSTVNVPMNTCPVGQVAGYSGSTPVCMSSTGQTMVNNTAVPAGKTVTQTQTTNPDGSTTVKTETKDNLTGLTSTATNSYGPNVAIPVVSNSSSDSSMQPSDAVKNGILKACRDNPNLAMCKSSDSDFPTDYNKETTQKATFSILNAAVPVSVNVALPSPTREEFFIPTYKEGFQGVWDSHSADLAQTPFAQFAKSFIPSFSDTNTCPHFDFQIDMAGLGHIDADKLNPPCSMYDLIKVIFLLSTAFACRRIIFGG